MVESSARCGGSGDAPEQLIRPKRESSGLSFARIEGLFHCVRARSIRALGTPESNDLRHGIENDAEHDAVAQGRSNCSLNRSAS
jgi:hypothetical protein